MADRRFPERNVKHSLNHTDVTNKMPDAGGGWQRRWDVHQRVSPTTLRCSVNDFPKEAPLLRLVTAVIAETHDEWQVCDRRYLSEGSMNKLYDQPDLPALLEELPAAKIAS